MTRAKKIEAKEIEVSTDPPINGQLFETDGNWGIILTHGEKSDITDEIFQELAKDLVKKNITVLYFRMPFRINKKRIPDRPNIQEDAFLKVWEWVHQQQTLNNKRWAIGGHDIGAKAAIRASMQISMFGEIPPIIALSFPLYPPNRPEKLRVDELSAIMGPILFCQGNKGNQGTYDRLTNQLAMMANFAEAKLIKDADHNFNVLGKPPKIVSKWLANDISSFLSKV